MKKVLILGGDGFCGWPTSLRFASIGYKVLIVDNLSRRDLDNKLSSESLTPISSIRERINTANKVCGDISFKNIDISKEPEKLRKALSEFCPDTIVHFAEQRAAPFSMIGDYERRYTVDNNITGVHNICSAVVDICPDTHIIHLGTMGVYGYTETYGSIPEGYLDITIKQTKQDEKILYPANPGSIYHMTKCLDQIIFQFYNKNWNLKITDLHQGIVWGAETPETKSHDDLINRFDYDGIYGTVLNRFIIQAATDQPISVYGTGGQTRAFIHISDTAECIKLAAEESDFDNSKVRIFNQVAEVHTVKDLANIVAEQYGSKIEFIDNPRKELSENLLEVSNHGLLSLGFKPIKLQDSLIDDLHLLANKVKERYNPENNLTSPKW